MNKFLYFAVSATDAIMVNADHIAMVDVSDADTVVFYFRSNNAVDFSGSATVDITSGKNKEWLNALGKAMVNTRRVVICVADVVNGEYFGTTDSDGTAIAATTCSAITLT